MSEDKQPKGKRVAPAPRATAALPAMTSSVVTLPTPMRRRPPTGGEAMFAAYHRTIASIGESQTAVASNVTAMALEMNGLARANLTAASEGMAALFGAKSLVDAIEIQLGFARRSLDAMVGGSAKLGEIGLRLANDAAKPMLEPFSAG
jgi:hypothetical protein